MLPTKAEYLMRIERYRNRAEEIRSVANNMHDAECRGILLRVADSYDTMIQAAQNAAASEELASKPK